ncbi:hypothetical protein, partial [Vibrio cholerae]|uniref:hypothetical protein n=1 Tax=Vibrio cholerae TaxID=666 RepID=UPI00112505A2
RHTDLTAERLNGDKGAEQVMRPYDKVIARAQVELGSMPNDQRVYRNLKLSFLDGHFFHNGIKGLIK